MSWSFVLFQGQNNKPGQIQLQGRNSRVQRYVTRQIAQLKRVKAIVQVNDISSLKRDID